MPDLGWHPVPSVVETVDKADRTSHHCAYVQGLQAVHVDVEILSPLCWKVDELVWMDATAPAKIVMRDVVVEGVVLEVFGTCQQSNAVCSNLE